MCVVVSAVRMAVYELRGFDGLVMANVDYQGLLMIESIVLVNACSGTEAEPSIWANVHLLRSWIDF